MNLPYASAALPNTEDAGRGADMAAMAVQTAVLLCSAVVRYSAPGIRPGERPFFLLAKRKKAKKALQFNTMVIYTSSTTPLLTHSPARRAQTEAYVMAQNAPSICRPRRLLLQAAGHSASKNAALPATRRLPPACPPARPEAKRIANPAAAFAAPQAGHLNACQVAPV